MKEITKAARVNSAIQVIQRMNDGMTVVAACNNIGMPRSTFYDIVRKNPEAIAEYQAMVKLNAKKQLGLILLSKTQILQRVIEDGLSENTAPRDRLAIYKSLSELESDLNNTFQRESEADAAIHEMLKRGPITKLQVSRMPSSEMTVTVDDETE